MERYPLMKRDIETARAFLRDVDAVDGMDFLALIDTANAFWNIWHAIHKRAHLIHQPTKSRSPRRDGRIED